MTSTERVRRHRAMKALREQREREAAAAELQAFVRAGLRGEDDEAQREIAEFLAALPDELAQLRHDLDAIRAKSSRKAGGAPPR